MNKKVKEDEDIFSEVDEGVDGDMNAALPAVPDPPAPAVPVELVSVHFLVDTFVGDNKYWCNEFADIPTAVAKTICDNARVEYAAN